MLGENKIAEGQLGKSKWLEHFRLTPHLDLDFVIGGPFSVGLPGRSSNKLKQRVAAAVISHAAGLSSIDYAYKRYAAHHSYDEDRSLGSEISDFLEGIIQRSEQELLELTRRDVIRLGDQVADATLLRVSSSLYSSKILANRGMLFDTLCLVRFTLEQIAWSCGCDQLEDEDAIFNLDAKKCIKKLGGIYPTSGRIYGFLSEFAHWNPRHHYLFLLIEDSRWAYIKASSEYKAIALCYVLLAVDIHLALIETIYYKFVKEHVVLSKSVKGRFKKNRPTRKLVERVSSSFPENRHLKQVLAFFP